MQEWNYDDLELLEQMLGEEGLALEIPEKDVPAKDLPATIPRRPERSTAPLTYQQQRLWFLHQLAPGSASYNISGAVRMRGPLQLARLEAALQAIIDRHDVLRTTFRSRNGVPEQVIHAHLEFRLEREPFRASAGEDAEAALEQKVIEETLRPFHLETGPLFRGRLFYLGPDDHVLVLTAHHILCDGSSIGLIIRELGMLYGQDGLDAHDGQAVAGPLPALAIQYGDYAAWQRQQLTSERQASLLEHWKSQLEDVQPFDLPLDFTRPETMSAVQGGHVEFHLPKALRGRIARLAESEGATPATLLFAAFQLLLARYARQYDLTTGYAVHGRTHLELEPLVGLFSNVLAIRTGLDDHPSSRTLLKRVQRHLADAFDHQDLPFESLVDALQPERHPHMNPIFQVVFGYQVVSTEKAVLAGLELERIGHDASARFDLELFVFDGADGIAANLVYDRMLFRHETVQQLARCYQALLEHMVARPDADVMTLSMFGAEEARSIRERWAHRQTFPATECVHTWFEAQAARAPKQRALLLGERRMRYGELNARANHLARLLRERGVGPEVRVALWFDRSFEMIVAMLGVLKAGGIYVPIDPHYPAERARFILEDCGAELILIREGADVLPPESGIEMLSIDAEAPIDPAQGENLPSLSAPGHGAYMIYTSGSTGRPKGVLVEHKNVVRLLEATSSWFQFGPTDVWTLFHSYAFDFSVWEIWGALLYGGRLVIVPHLTSRSPEAFYQLLHSERVTVLNQTPSAFQQLTATAERLGHPVELPLRYVIFGGEKLELSTLRAWMDHYGDERPRLINMYGITETTVHVTYRPITLADVVRNERSLIGVPIPDLTLYLLDEQLQPVPMGARGELVVGGDGVARGYHQRPELTRARFLPDPFSIEPNARMYRSGDLARYRADGELEYIGRMDHQVKLRGFRIELGEIEATLMQHPLVRDAVVLIRPDRQQEPTLTAWLVPALERLATDAAFARWATEQVASWQETYDQTYRQANPEQDDAFNIIGWNSSYTRQPIPAEEMAAWLDHTLAQLRALKPRRVLEIGCGTGLLLLNLAPGCEHYTAVDFSAPALEHIRATAARRGLSSLTLFHRPADDLQGVTDAHFDTVIINSVVQYFPSVDYLERVITAAIGAVTDGYVFVGDVRSLTLLRAFHASVAAFQASPDSRRSTLRSWVERALRDEEELVIDPAFFRRLAARIGKVTDVTLQVRSSSVDNELTRFRYDVVIRVGSPPPLQPAETYALSAPVARGIAADLRLEAWIFGEGPDGTLEEFRQRDAAFQGDVRPSITAVTNRATTTGSLEPLTNNPLYGRLLRRLIPMLRSWLGERLPEFMVPSAFVLMDALPLTAHGKRDHRALPDPGELETETRAETTAPHSPAEELMANLWCGVLNRASIGIEDDFFHAGGHSLRAAQLVNQIREVYRIEMPLRQLFETPTIAGLLPVVEALVRAKSGGPGEEIPHVPKHQRVPAAAGQRRLWFIDRLEPGAGTYHMPMLLRIDGALDVEALQRSLNALVDRHEVLRTAFVAEDGEPWLQVLEPSPCDLEVTPIEVGEDGEAGLQARLAAVVEEALRRPFDLEQGRLLRCRLLPIVHAETPENVAKTTSSFLLLDMHHIISDGWSLGVMARELDALYGAFSSQTLSSLAVSTEGLATLPPLPIRYSDYAAWQRRALETQALDQQRDYWRQKLAGLPPEIVGLTDHLHGSSQSWQGRAERFVLPRPLVERISALCRQEGATLFMLLLAAFKVLLYRYTGQADLAVGTPIAGRNRASLEGLIGFFLNTLVLRSSLEGSPSFRELLSRVRTTALEAYEHQDLPFEEVIAAVQPSRDRAHHPLFQVMFVLQNAPKAENRGTGPSVTPERIESGVSRFDLSLLFEEQDGQLLGVLEYASQLFEPGTIRRMGQHLRTLLEGIASSPDQPIDTLPILTSGERRAVLETWQGPAVAYDVQQTFPALIVQQARRTPEQLALQTLEGGLTYQALDARASALAHRLVERGVKPGEIVGLEAGPGLEPFIGLLAIQLCGAAYLPLDPDWPEERRRYMLEDSAARLVVSGEEIGAVQSSAVSTPSEQEREPGSSILPQVLPEHPAYVIYTSGSTGRPRGVCITHRNLMHSLTARFHHYGTPVGRYLLLSSLAFDSSVAGVFWTLLDGGTLILPPRGARTEVSILIDLMARHRVTHLLALPSLYDLLLEQAGTEALRALEVAIVAGESCPEALLERHRSRLPACQLHNEYGPTEATVWCTVWAPTPEEASRPMSIGRPVANTGVYILDAHLQPVPIGRRGELFVAGNGVAGGYLGAERDAERAAMSAGRFLSGSSLEVSSLAGGGQGTPVPSGRLYRTGDAAKWLEDGRIVLLERLDHQVKLRGFRIELEEIEAALKALLRTEVRSEAGVREAAVALTGEGASAALVAFVETATGALSEGVPDAASLRQALGAVLPQYMVPTRFVGVAQLPRLPNGKLDRLALRALEVPVLPPAGLAPRDALEAQISQVWAEHLGLDQGGTRQVGIREDFFSLGGNSLLALKVVFELERRLNRPVPLSWLFEAGTVEGLANRLRGEQGHSSSSLIAIRPGTEGALYCFHQAGGNVLEYFPLASALPPGLAVYGLQARGLEGREEPLTSVEALAGAYVGRMLEQSQAGPYHLLGHSFGGLIAFEVARQLRTRGATVGLVMVIDVPPPTLEANVAQETGDDIGLWLHLASQLETRFNVRLELEKTQLEGLSRESQAGVMLERLEQRGLLPTGGGIAPLIGAFSVYQANIAASASYRPGRWEGPMHVVASSTSVRQAGGDVTLGWQGLVEGEITSSMLDADHTEMLHEPHLTVLAQWVAASLKRV